MVHDVVLPITSPVTLQPTVADDQAIAGGAYFTLYLAGRPVPSSTSVQLKVRVDSVACVISRSSTAWAGVARLAGEVVALVVMFE